MILNPDLPGVLLGLALLALVTAGMLLTGWLFTHGLIGSALLLSAEVRAVAQALEDYKKARVEFRRMAVEATPKRESGKDVERRGRRGERDA